MRLLLDTHILLWALGRTSMLPVAFRNELADPGNEICFSAASIWEIAIKASSGRVGFENNAELIGQEASAQGFVELPITARHAARVRGLPPLHHDPFDRILLAQALIEPVWLLTSDRMLTRYEGPIRHISPRRPRS